MNNTLGIQTTNAGSGGGGGTDTTPIYQTVVGAGGTTTVTVPALVMTCSANTLVSVNGTIQNTGFTRVGNVYTFLFTLEEGTYVLFKN